MGYTVKDFIDSNKFPGMKLISDNSGINREIKGARIIAASDMEKFLGEGELLLTSLMVYEKLDERMMLSHLEELNKIYRSLEFNDFIKEIDIKDDFKELYPENSFLTSPEDLEKNISTLLSRLFKR